MDIKIITKNIVKSIIPRRVKNILTHESALQVQYSTESYSQEGEDILINRLLNCKKNGFFIDVGAHHPMRFSNTYMLYKRGWKGINIEPNPDMFNLFLEFRPRDININVGVSEKETSLDYYVFKEPALNTFSKTIKDERVKGSISEHINSFKIPTAPLSVILDQYKDEFKHIDFMTIDTEGLDLEVLKSNDWSKYRPKYLIIEDFEFTNLDEKTNSPIVQFLAENNYSLISKLFRSIILEDGSQR